MKADVFRVLGRKHTLSILYLVEDMGETKFNDFIVNLKIGAKNLTIVLMECVMNGLLVRTHKPSRFPNKNLSIFNLTPLGCECLRFHEKITGGNER